MQDVRAKIGFAGHRRFPAVISRPARCDIFNNEIGHDIKNYHKPKFVLSTKPKANVNNANWGLDFLCKSNIKRLA
jgi:hypothetical protein